MAIQWKWGVAEMMTGPRSSTGYDDVFPDDESWG